MSDQVDVAAERMVAMAAVIAEAVRANTGRRVDADRLAKMIVVKLAAYDPRILLDMTTGEATEPGQVTEIPDGGVGDCPIAPQ